MFTITQIKEAHSKVKSGADFPMYIKEIKQLGVVSYEHYVSDGHIKYFGTNGFTLSADAKWSNRPISEIDSIVQLKQFLKVHQQGQTDYPTFCLQAAEVGVEKWVVDTKEMTCIYFNKAGNKMLSEEIPQ